MSVPKGTIWQELRRRCLDAIPQGSRTNLTRPATLARWRESGFFKVTSVTRSHIGITAAADDLGGALLADVECLLDHAAEHQASIWGHVRSQEWLSPAWFGVTVYYWSYFLSLAFSRLTGRTAWFLPKDAVRVLRAIGPVSASAPGAGSFRLECGAVTTMTDRIVTLEKSKLRIHEEVWHLWFDTCKTLANDFGVGTSDSLEDRLFTAITRSAQNLGADWPSAFRNAVNYNPGFAYTAVRREHVLKSFAYLRTPATYDMTPLLDRFERNLILARTPSAIRQQPQVVLELLVDLTFLLHAITSELHNELIDRHGLDRRWRAARTRFLKANGLTCDDGIWPM